MSYIDPKIIEEIKQVDLFTYLRDNEPEELVKISRNVYCTSTHDSLKISNGCWYWWSRGIGGKSALDYLVKVQNMSFIEAAQRLIERNTSALPPPMTVIPKPRIQKPFALPPRSRSNDVVRDYLSKRMIDQEIIDDCIGRGVVYESHKGTYKNPVFVGLDAYGIPRYAMIRARFGDAKWEVESSEKRFAFKLTASEKVGRVHVFESAIDVLSYATHLKRLDLDWRKENLLSIAGVPLASKNVNDESIPQAIVQYLAENPHTKTICLRLDNDEPGLAAADRIATSLYGKYEVHVLPPEAKDWNDCLQNTFAANSTKPNQPKKKITEIERT